MREPLLRAQGFGAQAGGLPVGKRRAGGGASLDLVGAQVVDVAAYVVAGDSAEVQVSLTLVIDCLVAVVFVGQLAE